MEQLGATCILRSRRVVTGDRIRPAEVVIAGGRVADVVVRRDGGFSTPSAASGAMLHDVDDLLVAPGLVDTQINGAGPVDLRRDPAGLASLCAAAARHGVTTLLATLPSHDLDRALVGELGDAAAVMRRVEGEAPVATVAGLHLEGPFLAPARAGAHRLADLRPIDAEIVQAWARDPFVAMVTLAPELDGAIEAIETLTASGTVAAIGHTDAERGHVSAAVDAGARHVTHLWNAMAGLHHRAPGVVGAALTDERITAGLICDGAHVDPLVVRLSWQAMGPERLVLVSDAVASPETAHPGDGAAVIGADGTLQGSTTMLDQGVRNLIAFAGASEVDALATATRNPARLLGRSDLGVLAPGARADIVVFDDDLVPVHVMIGGRWTPDPGSPGS
ncbi:MAG: N-acetylglucosamine-6-phosphate deacetylase [Acidimicrobiales bacterium]